MNDTGKPCFMETVGQPQERSALAAAGSTQAPADIRLPVAATLQHTRGRWTSSCLFMLSVCVSASYVFVHRCVWLSACMPLSLTLSLSVSRSVCLFVLCVCVFDSLCRLYQSVFLSLSLSVSVTVSVPVLSEPFTLIFIPPSPSINVFQWLANRNAWAVSWALSYNCVIYMLCVLLDIIIYMMEYISL